MQKKPVNGFNLMKRRHQYRSKKGAGVSGYTEVGAVVGQGTLAGALVSQALLD